MSGLSKEQKDLILVFYFRCGEQESIDRGRDLIASSAEAAQLYADLEETLTDLDSIKYEPCPNNLVELTITRLRTAASSGQTQLEELLRAEEHKSVDQVPALEAEHREKWKNFIQVAAIAALFLVITGMGLPVFNNIRYNAWQTTCQAHMGNLGKALAHYADDYDGLLPSVPMAAGAPWWKIGHNGPESESISNSYFLILRLDYAQPRDFICPGQKDGVALERNRMTAGCCDFPSRRNFSYSFPRWYVEAPVQRITDNNIAMVDRNPIFVKVRVDTSRFNSDEFARVFVTEQLQHMLSPNHRGRGQNFLWRDGRVEFRDSRIINGDDVFMLNGVNEYRGCEAPCNNSDLFFVP